MINHPGKPGTRGRYNRGCRCRECTQANRVYGLAHWRAKNPDRLRVHAAYARTLLARLAAVGVTLSLAAKRTGLHRSTLRAIAKRKQVAKKTEDLLKGLADKEGVKRDVEV